MVFEQIADDGLQYGENTVNAQNIYLPGVTGVTFPSGSRAISFNITDSVMSGEFQKFLLFGA